MPALVTGASGLLGSHIVDRLLERGESVRALVRPSSDASHLRERGVELAVGDVADPASLSAAVEGVDVVYHAAAMVSDWGLWRDFQRITIDGTRNVLEAAAAAGVPRFLHVSTDSVYPTGPKLRGATLREDSPIETKPPAWDYYQRSKLAAERTAWEYHNSGRIRVSAVRPCLVLGERDRSIMPEIVAFLRGGRAVYAGRAGNRWHCVYAADAAEACILAATTEAAVGEAYNVAAEVLTQGEFFEAVAQVAGAQLPRRTVPFWLLYSLGFASETLGRLTRSSRRPSLTRFGAITLAQDYVLDTSKAERELGWRPKAGVREAIRRSVDWLESRRTQPVGG